MGIVMDLGWRWGWLNHPIDKEERLHGMKRTSVRRCYPTVGTATAVVFFWLSAWVEVFVGKNEANWKTLYNRPCLVLPMPATSWESLKVPWCYTRRVNICHCIVQSTIRQHPNSCASSQTHENLLSFSDWNQGEVIAPAVLSSSYQISVYRNNNLMYSRCIFCKCARVISCVAPGGWPASWKRGLSDLVWTTDSSVDNGLVVALHSLARFCALRNISGSYNEAPTRQIKPASPSDHCTLSSSSECRSIWMKL